MWACIDLINGHALIHSELDDIAFNLATGEQADFQPCTSLWAGTKARAKFKSPPSRVPVLNPFDALSWKQSFLLGQSYQGFSGPIWCPYSYCSHQIQWLARSFSLQFDPFFFRIRTTVIVRLWESTSDSTTFYCSKESIYFENATGNKGVPHRATWSFDALPPSNTDSDELVNFIAIAEAQDFFYLQRGSTIWAFPWKHGCVVLSRADESDVVMLLCVARVLGGLTGYNKLSRENDKFRPRTCLNVHGMIWLRHFVADFVVVDC